LLNFPHFLRGKISEIMQL